MTLPRDGIVTRLEAVLLLIGCAGTAVYVNPYCLQPFRDEKEALFIWTGGVLALWMAVRFLRGMGTGRAGKSLLPLLPILGIAAWSLFESLGNRGGFGIVEPGLPAKTDCLVRYLAYPLAGILFWYVASLQSLTPRNTRFIGTTICVLSAILLSGLGIEIAGDGLGYEWRPFLLGAFLAEGQGALKSNYFGSIGNSNFLAGYLAILSFATLGFALPSKWAFNKVLGILLFVGMFAVAILCRSKGALAGFAVGSVCFSGVHFSNLLSRKSRGGFSVKRVGGIVASFTLLFVVALALVFGSSKRREDFSQVVRLRGESLSQRVLLGYVGLEMWRPQPWLGIGPGEFRLRFLEQVAEILDGENGQAFAARVERLKSFKPVHVHNDFLEVLIEWGVVGYLSLSAFLITNIGLAWRRIRVSTGVAYGLRLGALSGMAAALGYAVFEFPFFLPSHLAAIAVFLGLSVSPLEGNKEAPRAGFFGRFVLGAPMLALAAFLLWQGTMRGLSSDLAGEGTRFLEEEKADQGLAVRRFRQATLADPGNADLNRLEALVEWRIENRPDRAIQALRRGAPISDDPLFELLEAQIHLEESRPREAAESLSPLLAVAPYLPGVGYLEGRIHESQGNLEKAKEAYARDVRATQSRPEIPHLDLPHLYLRYGSALERLGYYREAVWQYEKIADLESDSPLALLRLGRLYRDNFQDFPTAEGYFRKAMDSARQNGNPGDEEQARKEILELKKMREQMRKEAVLIENASPDSGSRSKQIE